MWAKRPLDKIYEKIHDKIKELANLDETESSKGLSKCKNDVTLKSFTCDSNCGTECQVYNLKLKRLGRGLSKVTWKSKYEIILLKINQKWDFWLIQNTLLVDDQ